MASRTRCTQEPVLNIHEEDLLEANSIIRQFSIDHLENLLVVVKNLQKFLSRTEKKRFIEDFQRLKPCVERLKQVDISIEEEGIVCCWKLQRRFTELSTHFTNSRKCGQKTAQKIKQFLKIYGNFQ